MNNIIKKLPHRRFLKNKLNNFKTGYYLPEKLVLNNKNEISIDKFFSKNQFNVFFIMSSSCSACNLEELEVFLSEYPYFHYVLFYESNEKNYLELKQRFDSIKVFRCEALKLQQQLEFDLFPCTIGTNKLGQVVACGLFNDSTQIKRVLKPLLKVTSNE
ncbi:hypothetical protein ACSVDA_20595 [Cytobacillus sp. Hm23]